MMRSLPTSHTRTRDPVPTDSRYECLVKVASGGMATVYVGRLRGKHGFSRLVAIKRAHAHLLDDEQLRRGLIAEARLASRIHDPHVVSVLDVDEPGEELMLVMDYVEGGSLSQLLTNAAKKDQPLAPGVVTRILLDSCAGLAAAHDVLDESGQPLSIVHRDVSPHNILVGVDGLSRIADFGIAKWSESTHATAAGLKGKFSYMAPEYIRTRQADRRVDVFGLGVVAWEAFTGQRLFRGDGELATIQQVLEHQPLPVSTVAKSVPKAFDAPIARALEKDPDARFASARELGAALEDAARKSGLEFGADTVGSVVRQLLGDVLDARRTILRDLTAASGDGSKSSTSSRAHADHAEGQATATATLDAAFATDARTLPIERPPPSSPAVVPAAGEPDQSQTLPEPRKPVRSPVVALMAATAAAVGLAVFAFTRGQSAQPESTPQPASESVASAEASAAVLPPTSAPSASEEEHPSATHEHAASAAASAEPTHRRFVRHGAPSAEQASGAAHATATAAQTATPPSATSRPALTSRPGLGY